ncbi:hypothetical protein NVV94_04465 [Pseudomonas sp. LS1212]|uniref:hypothetical protein n=1 Tax=Pseudomonas sp. LS1212 TaxID=2972478 RepID=UPI00215C2402|nr:hypothetical protein [Pseudomonas sp. LS1212]UVJ44846.1 hypothetical protein NVV94_04465 [Pseudomonas sp. LS1212]
MLFEFPPQRFSVDLRRLVQRPLNDVEDELLVRIALEFWYASTDLETEIRLFLETQPSSEHISRAGYLIQRLTRFSCATNERVSDALLAISLLKKPEVFDSVHLREPGKVRKDYLASEWCLNEGLGLKVQKILPFQTRHYEATQRAPMIGNAMDEPFPR